MNMIPLFFAAQTEQGGESLSTVSSAFSHLPYTGQPRGSEACMGAHTHTHTYTHIHTVLAPSWGSAVRLLSG